VELLDVFVTALGEDKLVGNNKPYVDDGNACPKATYTSWQEYVKQDGTGWYYHNCFVWRSSLDQVKDVENFM
jgi:hypothetical protein